jgi:hypothetical protein
LRMFKLGSAALLDSLASGCPLFNELGEVIGLLTIKEADPARPARPPVFAVSGEMLRQLLTVASE